MLSEIDDHRVPGPPEAPADPLAAVLRPVRAGNAFEETVERLLQIIKLGVVAHGERLPPERELAPGSASAGSRCARRSARSSRRGTWSRGAAGPAAPS